MKIKTRESLRDIRVFDKTKDLSERTRSGFAEISKNTEPSQSSSANFCLPLRVSFALSSIQISFIFPAKFRRISRVPKMYAVILQNRAQRLTRG